MIKLSENCLVFADSLDNNSRGMLNALINSDIGKDATIRIMPDVHAGKGCVIGTSMVTVDKLSPILLGGDIGCGITAIKFKPKTKITTPQLVKLEKFIREYIPSGSDLRKDPIDHNIHEYVRKYLYCTDHINWKNIDNALATLGGGNHFIEVDIDPESGDYWLIVHSGSRRLGVEVIDFWKEQAAKQHPEIPYEFAYVDGRLANEFQEDTNIVSHWAATNRSKIIAAIFGAMKWKPIEDDLCQFVIPHNYIQIVGIKQEDENRRGRTIFQLRKGCISASLTNRIFIPLNMQEGCVICKVYNNINWLASAPHGLGRNMTRTEAKENITLTQYKKSMEGIYTESVSRATIDESPMAYKPSDSVMSQLEKNFIIEKRLKPIYNFKPKGED